MFEIKPTEPFILQLAQIELLFQRTRLDVYYVPRNHQTIGGMWTADTWTDTEYGFSVRLEDEGSTTSILTETLHVYTTYGRAPVFIKGGADELLELYNRVFTVLPVKLIADMLE